MRSAAQHTTFMVSCNSHYSLISSLSFLHYYPYCLLLISLLHIVLGPTKKHHFEFYNKLFIYIHFRFSPLHYCSPFLERGVTSTLGPKPVKNEALTGRMFDTTFFYFWWTFIFISCIHTVLISLLLLFLINDRNNSSNNIIINVMIKIRTLCTNKVLRNLIHLVRIQEKIS